MPAATAADDPVIEPLRLPAGNGEELSVLLARSGPSSRGTVLYLHGFGSSQAGEKTEFFRRRFRRAGYAFCSFDFRGHGDSGGSMRDLSLTRNLEDVGVVLAELVRRRAEPVLLFGSSMGGLTALWFAGLHPDRVAAGLTIAPALGFAAALERIFGAETMARWRRDGVLAIVDDLGEHLVGWGLVEDLRRYDEARLAGRLDRPFLLVQGALDDRVDAAHVERFAAACPATELVLLPDGDHRLIDRLPLVWNLCEEFLGRHGFMR